MSAAKLTLPIDPVRTDEDWRYDFEFFSLDDEPEDWTGDAATLAFVPRAQILRAEHSFLLTSDSGALEMLSNGAGIRVGQDAMSDRYPTLYDFELRRHRLDGTIEASLVGSAPIEIGLSSYTGGELPPGVLSLSGGQGSVKVYRGPSGVRVVRGGGTRGPSGPPGVIIGPDEPDLQTGHQALWIQSGLGPDGDQFDIRIATGE